MSMRLTQLLSLVLIFRHIFILEGFSLPHPPTFSHTWNLTETCPLKSLLQSLLSLTQTFGFAACLLCAPVGPILVFQSIYHLSCLRVSLFL